MDGAVVVHDFPGGGVATSLEQDLLAAGVGEEFDEGLRCPRFAGGRGDGQVLAAEDAVAGERRDAEVDCSPVGAARMAAQAGLRALIIECDGMETD